MAFCGNCGSALGEGAPYCASCGAAQQPQQPADPGFAPPPPGPDAYSSPAEGGLPSSPPLWDFQRKLIPTGESIAKAFGENPTGIMKILAWIVRATFLDPRVARLAALDENGTRDALIAILLTALPGLLLGGLGIGALGVGFVRALVTTAVSTVVMLGIMVGILSALSRSLLGVRIPPGRLLRAIAYSEGANALSFVPVVGRLLGLWTIVSAAAAVREISGAETQKVAVFMVVGFVFGMVAAMAAVSILYFAI
jgi:hypothetical protein